jgi:hypothetical protein
LLLTVPKDFLQSCYYSFDSSNRTEGKKILQTKKEEILHPAEGEIIQTAGEEILQPAGGQIKSRIILLTKYEHF